MARLSVGAVFALGIVLGCAHPGYRILVANETADGALVRVWAGPGTGDRIYKAPPGASGSTSQGIAPFDVSVSLLDEECRTIQTVDIHAVGDWLVTFRDGSEPSTVPSEPPDTPESLIETDQCLGIFPSATAPASN
jgi:hypothetical protein